MIGVEDRVLALDFDIAACLRLQEWQDEREHEKWRATFESADYGSH